MKAHFEQYMRNGGGLVVVHAADNAFPNRAAYNEMTGIGGWRNRTEKAGPLWYMKEHHEHRVVESGTVVTWIRMRRCEAGTPQCAAQLIRCVHPKSWQPLQDWMRYPDPETSAWF